MDTFLTVEVVFTVTILLVKVIANHIGCMVCFILEYLFSFMVLESLYLWKVEIDLKVVCCIRIVFHGYVEIIFIDNLFPFLPNLFVHIYSVLKEGYTKKINQRKLNWYFKRILNSNYCILTLLLVLILLFSFWKIDIFPSLKFIFLRNVETKVIEPPLLSKFSCKTFILYGKNLIHFKSL